MATNTAAECSTAAVAETTDSTVASADGASMALRSSEQPPGELEPGAVASGKVGLSRFPGTSVRKIELPDPCVIQIHEELHK